MILYLFHVPPGVLTILSNMKDSPKFKLVCVVDFAVQTTLNNLQASNEYNKLDFVGLFIFQMTRLQYVKTGKLSH